MWDTNEPLSHHLPHGGYSLKDPLPSPPLAAQGNSLNLKTKRKFQKEPISVQDQDLREVFPAFPWLEEWNGCSGDGWGCVDLNLGVPVWMLLEKAKARSSRCLSIPSSSSRFPDDLQLELGLVFGLKCLFGGFYWFPAQKIVTVTGREETL